MNPRIFVEKCRSFKEGFKVKSYIIKDDNGFLITKESNIVKHLRRHFEKLQNIANDDVNPDKYYY